MTRPAVGGGLVDNIPEPVQRFLVDHITSVDQLEVLLLLRRRPDRAWTAAEVSPKP